MVERSGFRGPSEWEKKKSIWARRLLYGCAGGRSGGLSLAGRQIVDQRPARGFCPAFLDDAPGLWMGVRPGCVRNRLAQGANWGVILLPAWIRRPRFSGARPGPVPGIPLGHPLSGPIGFLHGDEVAGVPPVHVEAVGEEGHQIGPSRGR